MGRRFVPGTLVEHAGQRWRVERALGADAVLLRDDAGETVSADPTRLAFPYDLGLALTLAPPRRDELHHANAEWELASRRCDLVAALAALPRRTYADVDRVAAELGAKRRQVYALLRRADGGADVREFLPARPTIRAKRLLPGVETVVAHAIDQHYAKPSRPSLLSLRKEVDERCHVAGLPLPSYKALRHMWTAPSSQGVVQCFDQIACVHMSGLSARSHRNAGQDGFRDWGSKQHRGLHRGPLAQSECPASWIE